mmetsp:Transcript_107703/g.286703  ORF Transcript_107703/g.286703 Transcript_107703/m.286703 type:complete len:81 (-) Transcript_107703:1571-1813(-)
MAVTGLSMKSEERLSEKALQDVASQYVKAPEESVIKLVPKTEKTNVAPFKMVMAPPSWTIIDRAFLAESQKLSEVMAMSM